MKIEKKILFEPRDMWFGIYLTNIEDRLAPPEMNVLLGRYPYVMYPRRLYIYICIIPMFPLRLIFPLRKWRPGPFDETAKYIVEA